MTGPNSNHSGAVAMAASRCAQRAVVFRFNKPFRYFPSLHPCPPTLLIIAASHSTKQASTPATQLHAGDDGNAAWRQATVNVGRPTVACAAGALPAILTSGSAWAAGAVGPAAGSLTLATLPGADDPNLIAIISLGLVLPVAVAAVVQNRRTDHPDAESDGYSITPTRPPADPHAPSNRAAPRSSSQQAPEPDAAGTSGRAYAGRGTQFRSTLKDPVLQQMAASAAADTLEKVRSARNRFESDLRLMALNNWNGGGGVEWEHVAAVLEAEEAAARSGKGRPPELRAPLFVPPIQDGREAEVQRGAVQLTRVYAEKLALEQVAAMLQKLRG